MSDGIILETHKLKKSFGSVRAVDDVGLRVPRGQIYGFLGPNGSGKTTTIGMILGLIHPTAGSIELFGRPVTPNDNRVLQRVGAMVGAPAILPYLTPRQNLRLIARLHDHLPDKRIDEVLDMVGLSTAATRKSGDFSTGMKQRLGLAMALIHRPDLLILDEPTNGMDPAGMHELRTLLQSLVEEGVTVFLSSHLLHEVEQTCDAVAVLNQGRIVAEGPISTILGGEQIVKVRVRSTAETLRALETLPGVKVARANGTYVEVEGATSEVIVERLMRQGIVPSEVTSGHPDLEALFLKLTQGAE